MSLVLIAPPENKSNADLTDGFLSMRGRIGVSWIKLAPSNDIKSPPQIMPFVRRCSSSVLVANAMPCTSITTSKHRAMLNYGNLMSAILFA